MKPDVLLIEPMMAEIEAKLDLAYTMHRLFKTNDPEGFLRGCRRPNPRRCDRGR